MMSEKPFYFYLIPSRSDVISEIFIFMNVSIKKYSFSSSSLVAYRIPKSWVKKNMPISLEPWAWKLWNPYFLYIFNNCSRSKKSCLILTLLSHSFRIIILTFMFLWSFCHLFSIYLRGHFSTLYVPQLCSFQLNEQRIRTRIHHFHLITKSRSTSTLVFWKFYLDLSIFL